MKRWKIASMKKVNVCGNEKKLSKIQMTWCEGTERGIGDHIYII